MKIKVLSVILAAVLLLSACGKNNDDIYGSIDISEESKASSNEESSSSKDESSLSSEKSDNSSEKVQQSSSNNSEISAEEVSSTEDEKSKTNGKKAKPHLSIDTQKEIYPENEEISEIFFKVTNETKRDINLSQFFRMQKYDEKSGEWIPMKSQEGKYSGMLNDYESIEIAKAGVTYYVSAEVEDFLSMESKNYGKYRIEIFAENQSFYGVFEIGQEKSQWSESHVSANTRYDIYPSDVKYIEYEIKNKTDDVLNYNSKHELFKYDENNGEWKKYPFLSSITAYTDELYNILPKASVKEIIYIQNVYKSPMEKGKYKIVKFVGDKQIVMNFEIDDTLSKFDKNIISKIQKCDEFRKVKFKRHNFSSPMSYQGIISEKLSNGAQIYVFYADGAVQIENQMKLISGGGYNYKTSKNDPFNLNTEIKFDKKGDLKPHFFTTESEIILYYGQNDSTIKTLEAQFGKEYRV